MKGIGRRASVTFHSGRRQLREPPPRLSQEQRKVCIPGVRPQPTTNKRLLSTFGLGAEASGMPSAMSSSPCTPVEEERPGSSLSTASRSSRIPRLTRSASLRIKSTSENKTDNKSKGDAHHGSKSSSRGIVRSASFVTSRGMGGMTSPSSTSILSSSCHPSASLSSHRASSSKGMMSLTHTPETPRRFSSHGSSYSRRTSSASDRKSHRTPSPTLAFPPLLEQSLEFLADSSITDMSYAGLGPSPWHHPGYQNHLRRPNFLPVSAAPSFGSYGHSSLPFTPASQPETPSRSPDTDLDDGGGEADSVKSFGSVSSALSCDAGLARHSNYHHHHGGGGGAGGGGGGGGSCWGGSRSRNSKYVLHCRHNHELDPETYLTPTQRAARKIRELKSLLSEARREVQERDTEIGRLTRELVELRLIKARTQQEESTGAKDDGNSTQVTLQNGDLSSSDRRRQAMRSTPTPKTSSTPSEGSEPELSRLMDNLNNGAPEATTSHLPVASPAGGSVAETTEGSVDLTRSLADSGHYDDLTSPCLSSRDPFEASQNSLRDRPTDEEDDEEVDPWTAVEETEARLREEYERREDQLKRNHMDEYHELKEKHNDRVEALLSKLSDANLKYFELRPLYDRSQERIRELEREITKLKDELTEAELRHQKMYLQMFLKGQQAAKLQADDEQDAEEDSQSSLSSNGPMVDLMKQLARTEEELEKMKSGVPILPFPLPFSGVLSKAPCGAALLDGKQAINLYLQGRRQVLYHREVANRNNNKYRNGELDPEVTLQFLKSAIYYFLTDKDNAKGHLRAIESILGYTDSERHLIDKVVK
ncbi:protein quick-to-court-like isoform X2 [Macrobrachium nipponense]|uniref:protein quick-to-court-like isoform X2 n=1 Tax=Macrobrachium nipponense TaxID=159736 RepID=UPI0030C8B616